MRDDVESSMKRTVKEEKIKVTALYLLENEGFHSSKDEGADYKKEAHRHSGNPV